MKNNHESQYEVVWPLAKRAVHLRKERSGLVDLNGITICEIWDSIFNGDKMFKVIRDELNSRYAGLNFVGWEKFGNIHGPDHQAVLSKLEDKLKYYKCDAVIVGVAA